MMSYHTLAKQLLRHVPDAQQMVVCPVHPPYGCALRRQVWEMVIHLNDESSWTRERIADWLDGLQELGMDLTVRPEPVMSELALRGKSVNVLSTDGFTQGDLAELNAFITTSDIIDHVVFASQAPVISEWVGPGMGKLSIPLSVQMECSITVYFTDGTEYEMPVPPNPEPAWVLSTLRAIEKFQIEKKQVGNMIHDQIIAKAVSAVTSQAKATQLMNTKEES